MDKITIGIPRCLYYYYHYDFLKLFFEELGIKIITSPKTNKEIIDIGSKIASDEMCLSLKEYLGHAKVLEDKCDYLLIMRIYNYGRYNQMCTNFFSLPDLVNNLITENTITINIDYMNKNTLYSELKRITKSLGIKYKVFRKAYTYAKVTNNKQIKLERRNMYNRIKSKNKKILVISHPYVMYDNYLTKNIKDFFDTNNITLIYSDKCTSKDILDNSNPNIYWHYEKYVNGAIKSLSKYVDGLLFISSFPCGLDSLINELEMRNTSLPYLNINLDGSNINTGIETRLESFVDIINA